MPSLFHFFVFPPCFLVFFSIKSHNMGKRGNNVAIVAIRWCLKQIIKHHFVLGNARIHVALKTITADKRQLYGLPSFRFFHKTGNFVSQNLIIILIDGKLSFREFHFA